jgi:hypothetical protein
MASAAVKVVRSLALAVLAVAAVLTVGGPSSGATAGVWSVVPSPSPGSSASYLADVTCVAVDDCTAVGESSDGVRSTTVVLHWDGTVWSVVATPNVGSGHNVLHGVSCVGHNHCVAVGNF